MVGMMRPSVTDRPSGWWISTLGAMSLAAALLLTLLGHGRLTDWDEGIYASISRGMLHTGWLVPHWNGQLWLEKPPLMLWITAFFFRVFGVSEFTVRLGSALSGVALVGLLHGWLALRRNELTAWVGTLLLLSTMGFLHVARVGEMDVLLSLGCAVGLIGLCEAEQQNAARGHRIGWLLFWIGFAVALMTKGAASATLAITLAVMLGCSARLRRHVDRWFLYGLVIFLLLVLPWHVYMLLRFRDAFLQQYLGLHVLTRATSQIEGHLSHWWFYLRVIAVSAAPWMLLYPFSVVVVLRRPSMRAVRPFAVFALVELGLFSAVQTRLPHYIAPLYPALSVVTACWLGELLAPMLAASERPRMVLWKAAGAAGAVFVIAALLTAKPRSALHSPRLPNGDTTPDNREEIALLKQVFAQTSAAVSATPGPLLTLRSGHYQPIPTVIFYADRQVQQVSPGKLPDEARRDKYVDDPIALRQALADGRPHLLLAERGLLAQLPHDTVFTPVAASATLVVGQVEMR
jgi:4-amino-4-deoxy-L-arabinose transferase-like glycosyltransferase